MLLAMVIWQLSCTLRPRYYLKGPDVGARTELLFVKLEKG